MGQSAPIFVVGMNGSGTGALTRSLAQHSQLYAFPGESRVFLTYMGRFPAPPNLSDTQYLGVLEDVSKDPGLTRWNGHQPLPILDNPMGPRTVAGALDRAFLYFAEQEGVTRWCEKTPMNARCIESLVAHFPDAKIVHVIRDGRDAALSFQRRFGFSPTLSVFRWKKLVREAARQGATVGEACYFELHYEDLTTSPADVLRSVCEFLDLEFEDGMLSPVRPTNAPMLAGTFVANSGKWRELATPAQIETMENIAGRTLQGLGYGATNADGDQNLPAWRVFLYEVGDGLRSAQRYASRVFSGSGSLAHRLRVLSGIAVSSLRARLRRR